MLKSLAANDNNNNRVILFFNNTVKILCCCTFNTDLPESAFQLGLLWAFINGALHYIGLLNFSRNIFTTWKKTRPSSLNILNNPFTTIIKRDGLCDNCEVFQLFDVENRTTIHCFTLLLS